MPIVKTPNKILYVPCIAVIDADEFVGQIASIEYRGEYQKVYEVNSATRTLGTGKPCKVITSESVLQNMYNKKGVIQSGYFEVPGKDVSEILKAIEEAQCQRNF